jgi:hypothetical protein
MASSSKHEQPSPGVFDILSKVLEEAEKTFGELPRRSTLDAEQVADVVQWFTSLANNDRAIRELKTVTVDDRDALCKRISDWLIGGAADPSFITKYPNLIAYCSPVLTHFATAAKRAIATRRVVSGTTNPFGLPTGEPDGSS